eukprot:gnl/TRDRNA2_/TRDRNA2_145959_c0_seq1.p1 gnl/TRDRNA2_/TRDRNA2_145959_c0~~gnl/TRDRNA2_/TRDRNA2_145959_c0_seq1.p1  ORF type:complete len:545 (+),score=40.88 gnl/TRDRNA2_/TRDRNA2_145959_c0_seq1:197-1636(+)
MGSSETSNEKNDGEGSHHTKRASGSSRANMKDGNDMANDKSGSVSLFDQPQVKLLSSMMLIVFGAEGLFFSFQPVFLASMFSPAEVGLLTTMQKFVGVVVNPLVAGFADIHRKHRVVMLISALAQPLLQMSLFLPRLGFNGVASILLLHALFRAHIMNIMDACSIAAVGARYGSIRLFGAIGYGALAFVGGGLLSVSGGAQSMSNFVATFGLSSILHMLSVPGVAKMNLTALSDNAVGKKSQPSTLGFFRKVFSIRTGLFYLITFCSGVSSAIPDVFKHVYLAEQGASGTMLGVGTLTTCLAEVPFYQFSTGLLRRWGIAGCLAVAQAAYVCRFLWLAALPSMADMTSNHLGISRDVALWTFLPSEILHGFTMAVLWSAVAQFASSIAPDGMQTTSVSVASTMHGTLGFGVGSGLLGLLFSNIGGQNTLKVAAVFAAANFALCNAGLILYGKQWDRNSVSLPKCQNDTDSQPKDKNCDE